MNTTQQLIELLVRNEVNIAYFLGREIKRAKLLCDEDYLTKLHMFETSLIENYGNQDTGRIVSDYTYPQFKVEIEALADNEMTAEGKQLVYDYQEHAMKMANDCDSTPIVLEFINEFLDMVQPAEY